MDYAFPIGVAVAFLGLILAMLFLCYMELQKHAHQREELNRMLIMALFRMSKKQIKAIEEQSQRIDALGVSAGCGVRVRVVPSVDAEGELLPEDETAPKTLRSSK